MCESHSPARTRSVLKQQLVSSWGLRGLARHPCTVWLVRGRFQPAGFWGAPRPLGMAPGGQAGAQDGGASRPPFGQAPAGGSTFGQAPAGGSTVLGRLVSRESTRLVSIVQTERMELIDAVKEQDVEKVKVRRPLEAVPGTEYGPWRGVCLGLGQCTLDDVVARPIRPCCVESSSYVRRRSGNSDVACRRSSVPVTTSRSVTRTLPCHIAESPNFSPPPSPAIAVSATF